MKSQLPVVEFFIEIGVASTYVQFHKAGGPAVIHYSLARIKTIPTKGRKLYKNDGSVVGNHKSNAITIRLLYEVQIKRNALAFWKTKSQILIQ